MKRSYIILLGVFLLAGCANNDVIVDRKGVDERQYQRDLADCEQYAAQINTPAEAAEHGAIGAVVGGLIGAAVGDSRTAERVAGVGGVSGAAKGASRAERRKDRIVFNCLRGRGYKVLG